MAIAVAVGLAVAPAAAGAQPVTVKRAIVYGEGQVRAPSPGGFDLLMDLYRPASSGAARRPKRLRPAMVLIHGGGFSGGTRGQPDFDVLARRLARNGVVVANIDYRLISQDAVPSRRVRELSRAVPDVPVFNAMVAAVDDTLTAFDWLRERAGKLRIDMRHLGIAGGSAGAITAVHVAYALDEFGIEAPRLSVVGDLWGGIFFDVGSNGRQLEKGDAPLFAVHGDADPTVPVALDDRLVARARRVGVPVEYHRVPDAGHGFGGTGFFTREVRPGETAFDRMVAFFLRRLR